MNKVLLILFIILLFNSCSEKQPETLEGWWVIDPDYIEDVVDKMKASGDLNSNLTKEIVVKQVQSMAKKMTLIFTKDEMIMSYGKKEGKTKYKLISNVENKFTISVNGEDSTFIWENGRIYDSKEAQNGNPGIYFRKLSESEITQRKELIAKSKMPPATSAKPDKRIRYLVYTASPEQVTKLLKEQKDLLTIKREFDNETVLFQAVYSGKLDLVKTLLDAGASVKDLGYRKKNLLFEAVGTSKTNKEIFQLLIDRGVDINGLNESKETVLMHFCQNSKDVDFLKFLLSFGMDVNAKCDFGDTALSEALGKGWVEGAKILLEKGADIKSAQGSIIQIGRSGHLEAMKFLIDKGIVFDDYGRTALFGAVKNYRNSDNVRKTFPELVEVLKDHVNAKDKGGKNVLFDCREKATAEILIEAGADPNVKSNSGYSLLDRHSKNQELFNYLKTKVSLLPF